MSLPRQPVAERLSGAGVESGKGADDACGALRDREVRLRAMNIGEPITGRFNVSWRLSGWAVGCFLLEA
jgi:hypothetical protein